jgi:hypothetical protein
MILEVARCLPGGFPGGASPKITIDSSFPNIDKSLISLDFHRIYTDTSPELTPGNEHTTLKLQPPTHLLRLHSYTTHMTAHKPYNDRGTRAYRKAQNRGKYPPHPYQDRSPRGAEKQGAPTARLKIGGSIPRTPTKTGARGAREERGPYRKAQNSEGGLCPPEIPPVLSLPVLVPKFIAFVGSAYFGGCRVVSLFARAEKEQKSQNYIRKIMPIVGH